MPRSALARSVRTAALVCAPLTVAGCFSGSEPGPAPLVAAPSAPIQRQELPAPTPAMAAPAPVATTAPPPVTPPLDPNAPPGLAGDPLAPPVASEPLPPEPGTQVAAAPPAAAPAPAAPVNVGRTDLLGRWTISSGGESCDIYMSLTTWTGGYRASTRGCNSPALAGISAWDLSGRTVTLKGGDGSSTVASLSASDGQNFSGSTSAGGGISFSR